VSCFHAINSGLSFSFASHGLALTTDSVALSMAIVTLIGATLSTTQQCWSERSVDNNANERSSNGANQSIARNIYIELMSIFTRWHHSSIHKTAYLSRKVRPSQAIDGALTARPPKRARAARVVPVLLAPLHADNDVRPDRPVMIMW